DAGQQRIAIDVLGYVQNKNAGPALFAFAAPSGAATAETALRVRAMIACGALRDPALLPKYEAHLFPKPGQRELDEGMPTDAVAVAATWGIARMGDKRALPLLRGLVKRGTPEMRAFALLGLAQLKDKSATSEMAAIVKSRDADNMARAAAAYGL